MKKTIYIKDLKDYTPTNPEYNAIEIRTDYTKGYGLMVYLQEWEHKTGDYNSFCFDLFGSKKARKILVPMKRKNAKVIAEAEKNFFENEAFQELIQEMK